MADPIFDIFREEARDHLGALERGFLDLETADDVDARRTLIDGLFRHAHSLKSDAKVVGLGDLKQAAQTLEDVLDDLRDHPDHIRRESIDLGLSRFDQVRQAFEQWRIAEGKGASPGGRDEPALPDEPTPAPGTPSPPRREDANAVPVAEESFTVKVTSERLDRMLNLAGEVRISQGSGAAIAEQLRDVRNGLSRFVQAGARQASAETRHFIETALDQVRRIEDSLRKKRVREDLLVESLEADIRQARLLPLAMLADSLRRAVRDLAQSLGKEICYEADVGKILLDKAVIESLREPLLHLVRNAADHGVETPAERRAAGKPAAATIRLAASPRGPLVRIAISDDGRGIHHERVRQRLQQRGDLDETQLNSLTEDELHVRLFQPGFSTAPAGEVSGRGVGLDVVLDTVRRLQGHVEVQSQAGWGATFVITVPMTVATVRIMTVLVGGQYYGIPSTAIIRTGRATREQLRELEGHPILPLDGQPVRWAPLADWLGAAATPRIGANHAWSYVLIERQGVRLAVAVDDLEDESEVLLKPLGFPLQGLPGVVGATIRSDGAVQLVLDLSSIAFAPRNVAATPAPDVRPAAKILVVDDSPTTRAVLRNVFTAAGYAVRTAADGVDALERLRTQRVDLVVSDIEMPRLGGLDLTRQIKTRFGLPVILVTGREKEEHRREGLEAGADAYVVKSTLEGAGLLDVVRQFV